MQMDRYQRKWICISVLVTKFFQLLYIIINIIKKCYQDQFITHKLSYSRLLSRLGQMKASFQWRSLLQEFKIQKPPINSCATAAAPLPSLPGGAGGRVCRGRACVFYSIPSPFSSVGGVVLPPLPPVFVPPPLSSPPSGSSTSSVSALVTRFTMLPSLS